VDVHPDRRLVREPQSFDILFEAKALRTNESFREAYRETRAFGKVLGRRGSAGGFMKNLVEQRICSSIHAGLSTVRALLDGQTLREEEDEGDAELAVQTGEEREALDRLLLRLERIEVDPKLSALIYYLDREKWLELGVIVFSQYYDTARWVAEQLAQRYPDDAIGLYAGAGRSRLFQRGESVACRRDALKEMVAEHQIRVMVATDAACEGLNLQTLGTLVNLDLPWNPTRLEQRIGRIKRFGQKRDMVDTLNLVNEQTVDEKIYDRLSERMRDRYDLFGSVPDTIKTEWIDDIEALGLKMDEYIDARREATGFDLRYTATMEPPDKDWRDCTEVLSRRDFLVLMTTAWTA
jgi:superfamily II DNA/RNA helicase